MKECIFCEIANKKASAKTIFENEIFLAFKPLHQISKGHTLVVSKKHFESIFDIDKNTLEKL